MVTVEKCDGCEHFTTKILKIDEHYNMIIGDKLNCKIKEENCIKEK